MSGDFEKALMNAAVEGVKSHLRERLDSIRHPDTGEFPTVLITGNDLDHLSVRVEGSPELLALVQETLGDEADGMELVGKQPDTPPRVFLSYGWEDRTLAQAIAKSLQASGIDTWWAEWEIGAGDSLRQKIDEGIANCTHFIVLLTPTSIEKAWVNQEMDAGLVRKLREQAMFIPLRHKLAPDALPPLLSGMLSPEVNEGATDLRDLVNDIHGVSRKPALGEPPAVATLPKTGYSSAATAVAQAFVEASKTAGFGDPELSIAALCDRTQLSEEDVTDALYELNGMVQVHFKHVLPEDELFATFDKYFCEWNPETDALRLAADLINNKSFPCTPADIAELYEWSPRRLNPAISYLINRKIIRDMKAIGTAPWVTVRVDKTDATRRFVKSRS